MSSEAVVHALTTKNRIKDRIQITVATHDTLFERLVSSVTDFIEAECDRRFKRDTYTNEVYSVYGKKQEFILLKQTPVIGALASAQYRAGTVSNPNWTDFLVDNYEILEDGASGIVKIYGGGLRGINGVRFTYTAGYLIDFDNPTDVAKHTLPFDLSDIAERLAIRLFKKRDSEGKTTESFEGGSVSWSGLLDEVDKQIIARYRRLPTFV